MKIAVGIPVHGSIKSQTSLSLMEMMKLPYKFFPIFQYGAYVSQNRQNIVNQAQEKKCTHLLFIDHDMKFAPITIDLLIKHDKDIVSALYNYRFKPLKPMVKMFGHQGGVIIEDWKNIPDSLFKVAGIGMGCCLIKMSVFDKIKKPYFPMLWGSDGTVVRGEDIGFCERVRDEGVEIWVDPTLTCKHIGDFEF